MTRRFAEDTKVPVSRSTEELTAVLRKAGADQIAVFESAAQSAVGFTLGGRMYRLSAKVNPKAPNPGQDERRAWRLLLLLAKAKLEAVADGATTVEREFLADMILPDGQTMGAWAAPQLALAYQTKAMPAALMLEGPRDG